MKSTTCKRIHRIKQNRAGNRPRASPQTRALLGFRLKTMCADAGLSIEQTGKLLHVTPRTVRNWISGRVAVPYAAYRLLRILGRFELPDPSWRGWIMHSGCLWSPEGHRFVPADSNWWGRLVNQARLWREQYARESELRALLLRAGRAAPGPEHGAGGDVPGPAQDEPNRNAGRAAQPPGLDLSNKHFGTYNGFSLGERAANLMPRLLVSTDKTGDPSGRGSP